MEHAWTFSALDMLKKIKPRNTFIPILSHKPLNENHIFHEFSDIVCNAKIRYLKSVKVVFVRTIYLKMYMVQKKCMKRNVHQKCTDLGMMVILDSPKQK